jgi:hypothetical protein
MDLASFSPKAIRRGQPDCATNLEGDTAAHSTPNNAMRIRKRMIVRSVDRFEE